MRVWDRAAGREVLAFGGHGGLVTRVAFVPESRLIASGGWDGRVRVWDSDTGQDLLALRGHRNLIHALAVDGERVVTADRESVLRIWTAGK